MTAARRATLTGALLARKGAAVPTGFATIRPVPVTDDGFTGAERDALPAAAGKPVPRPASCRGDGPESLAPGAANNQRARFTLRLDRDRHLRLRLTAAHLDRSLQDVLIEALDRYLEQVGPEVLGNRCACLAADRLGGTR